MGHRFRVLTFAFAAALAVSAKAQPPAASPRPEKILDEYVRAVGGAKAMAGIQTETIAGSLSEAASGAAGSFARIVKAPDRYYSEMVSGPERFIEAYNGKSAWGQVAQGEAHTLAAADAREVEAESEYWNSRLADTKKAKLGLKLVGVEKVRGRDAFHLQVTVAQGIVREVYFDTQTHLIVHEEGGGEQRDYADYRAVNGIRMPFEIEVHKGGHDYTVSVTRAEVNLPVDNSVFDFPKSAAVALPDMKALFLDLGKNQKELEELRHQYTYHMTMETELLDSKNLAKGEEVREFDVLPLEGGGDMSHYVGKDGKPLEGDEKKKADAEFDKNYAKATKERAKQRAEDEAHPEKAAKEKAKADKEDEANVSSILRAELFTNPRRERFRGQEVLAFDFAANPDYKPKSTSERLAQSLAGMVLVDEQAHEVVRVEAHFNAGFKLVGGVLASVGKGSYFVFEQTKVNGEVWLPSYSEFHIDVRVLLFKARANGIQRFTGYKKYDAASKIVAVVP